MSSRVLPLVLVIEDSDEDFAAVEWSLKDSDDKCALHRTATWDEALAYLRGAQGGPDVFPRPALMLLDLNLPGTDGREALRVIKQDKQLQVIPVVIVTTSSDPKDVEACYRAGACGYLNKPVNFTKFKQSLQTLVAYWFETVALP